MTRLDRVGRSLRELLEIVANLEARGVHFVSLEERLDTSSAAGELVFHVFGVIAHFEQRLISERPRDGIAAARKRGRTAAVLFRRRSPRATAVSVRLRARGGRRLCSRVLLAEKRLTRTRAWKPSRRGRTRRAAGAPVVRRPGPRGTRQARGSRARYQSGAGVPQKGRSVFPLAVLHCDNRPRSAQSASAAHSDAGSGDRRLAVLLEQVVEDLDDEVMSGMALLEPEQAQLSVRGGTVSGASPGDGRRAVGRIRERARRLTARRGAHRGVDPDASYAEVMPGLAARPKRDALAGATLPIPMPSNPRGPRTK